MKAQSYVRGPCRNPNNLVARVSRLPVNGNERETGRTEALGARLESNLRPQSVTQLGCFNH